MDHYQGKIAVVTGGASGIGKALAEALGQRVATVVVADLDGARAETVAAGIREGGGSSTAVSLDVRDAAAFEKVLTEAASKHGRLDFLFNNAGIAIGGEERYVTDEDWKKVLDVNLHGVVHGARAAYALMVRQGSGHIVNTASAAGLIPLAGEISYTTAKYAVVGLSHALRIEGARLGVKVSVVCPGFIDTPILGSPMRGPLDSDKLRKLIPALMAPAECARHVLEGVAKNRATIVVTRHAKALWMLTRVSPDAALWVAGRVLDRMRSYARKS
jgi:NAD(P)-dependent dehydrogenase (short-subunit alcohol dehydrogenase family)